MICRFGSSLIMIFVMSDEEISLSIEFDFPYGNSTFMTNSTSKHLCDNTSESPLGLMVLMIGNIVTPVFIESELTIDLWIFFYMFSQFLSIILR